VVSTVLVSLLISELSTDWSVIDTDLWRHMPSDEVREILESIPTKSLGQGAATILVAALDPKLSSEWD
jgi:hypothetical protein